MRSLLTSLLGAAPDGGVTAGALESGPLVGVFAVVEVALVDLRSALSALFSLPTAIVLLEPLEPQPATRAAAAASSASAEAPRRRLVMRAGYAGAVVTVAQPNGLGRCVPATPDRARIASGPY